MDARFNIARQDQGKFRNFVVQIGREFLIDRNDDFYSELSEWVDGVLTLMKSGRSYFSATSGFTPFFATLVEERVEFETANGVVVYADFLEVVTGTIVFLFKQSRDEAYFDRDADFFLSKANSLLAGFRFRFKDKYGGFVDYLRKKQLLEDVVSI